MACHYAHVGSTGFECSESYAREIRNQVLDFIATNPPGFGVNWACTMDVGIRLVNMLVSRDIAISAGMLFDEQFEVAFMGSVVAHAQHIASNLEWSPKFRGNHYLADIVALLFAAVYLPSGENVDVWLSLATEELLAEIACQFHEDGSNYEASLCYHRLSSEIVLWGLALLANLPNDKRSALEKPRCWKGRTPPPRGLGPVPLHFQAGADFTSPVPLWCWQRLAKMGEFTQALTRPDGLVVQFGDNDSGRFIVLGSGEQLRAGSDPRSPAWSLDHRSFVASVQALYRNDIDGKADVSEMGARILRSIAGFDSRQAATSEWLTADRDPKTVGNDRIWADIVRRFAVVSDQSQWTCEFTATSPGLLDGLWLRCFLGMGCYVLCGTHFYLAIRCGEIGLAGLGAHAHCDQLAIELVMNGKDRVRDPGSFIYTALPAVRNSYRSANAHHVPRVAGREPANLKRGVFDLRGTAEGECLYFGARGFIGRHAGYGDHVYRIVELADDRIVVRDFTEGSLVIADPSPASLPFSPGYGLVAV